MANKLLNNKEITVLFGGDTYFKNNPEIDEKIINIVRRVDYFVINLEAPILNNKLRFEKRLKSGLNLYQKEDIIKVFKKLKIRYIGGANNHIMDFGIEGIKSTIEILDKNNIFHSGFGMNLKQMNSPLELENTNIQILCLGEDEFGASKGDNPGYYSLYDDKILDQIKNLKKYNKFIVIFAHGGGEEIPLPSNYIHDRFRQFIDNGADLIIGHHPHVPQGYEEYKSKLIFYSLGNFIHSSFNQSMGILLKVIIFNSGIKSFQVIPLKAQGRIIEMSNNSEIDNYIYLCNKILRDNLLRKGVYQEQANHMFASYYRSYFKEIFSLKKSLKGLIKRCLRKSRISGELESEMLLLNLIRNKSHKEFIETALEIRTGEIKDLRNSNSRDYFFKLMGYINKFIKIS